MIRWKYVIPRLALLTIVVAVLWLGLNPVLRLSLIHTGQMMTGARVEVGPVSTSLMRSRAELRQIVVADPNDAMNNVFEVDRAVLDIESSSLLRRKLVIREGRLTGVRLNTDRDSSGLLVKEREPQSEGVSMAHHVAKKGEKWLKQSAEKLQADLENELHSVDLIRELRQRWPRRYRDLEERAKDLGQRGEKLVDQVKMISEKPLENIDLIHPATVEIDEIRREIQVLRLEVIEVREQVRKDREAVVQAKRHDERYLREKLWMDKLDGETLTQYLLGPEWSSRIKSAITWIQWSRRLVPAKEEAVVQRSSRGVNALFPGYHATPVTLIRRLVLDGQGSIDNQPFSFRGTARDLTPQPKRHQRPATIELTAEGAARAMAQVTLDRRSDIAQDRIIVEVPEIAQAARILGKEDQLAVTIAPGMAGIKSRFTLIGDELAGHIIVDRSEVELTPRLSDEISTTYLTSNVQSALDQITHLHVKVIVSGTLRQPRWKLESTLGPQLAAGLSAAIQSELEARQEQLLNTANRYVDQNLNELEQQLVDRHGTVLRQLEIGDQQLGLFKQQIASRLGGSSDKLLDHGKKLFNLLKR